MEQLRSKHNKIKFNLLEEAANKLRNQNTQRKLTMLDLGIGRANDAHKWSKIGIDNVVGIDSSKEQLDQARKRIRPETQVKLIQLDLSSNNLEIPNILNGYSFDIVCAFFSVHYFSHNLNKILTSVTLAPDCQFVSTFMTLRPCMFLLQPYFENDYIFIKRTSQTHIDIKFKDSPYFDSSLPIGPSRTDVSSSIELAIDQHMISHQLKNIFKENVKVTSFVDYYDNIRNIYNDILLVELMHVSLHASIT